MQYERFTVRPGVGGINVQSFGLFRIPTLPETVSRGISDARVSRQLFTSVIRRINSLSGAGLHCHLVRHASQIA